MSISSILTRRSQADKIQVSLRYLKKKRLYFHPTCIFNISGSTCASCDSQVKLMSDRYYYSHHFLQKPNDSHHWHLQNLIFLLGPLYTIDYGVPSRWPSYVMKKKKLKKIMSIFYRKCTFREPLKLSVCLVTLSANLFLPLAKKLLDRFSWNLVHRCKSSSYIT